MDKLSSEDLLLTGENHCQSHQELSSSERQGLSSRSVSKSEHDTISKSPVSILRTHSNKCTCSAPERVPALEISESCVQSKRGVHFSDGSSPGVASISEDKHRKVPCYEPSPAAICDHPLNLARSNWEELLRHSSDINSLKTLLDQTTISGNLEPGMDDAE